MQAENLHAPMKKWIRRIMLGLAMFLSLMALLSVGGFALLRKTPDFYHKIALSPAQREQAARRAETKFTQIQNLAADSHAAEVQAISQSRPLPATNPQSWRFSFTDEELNALFHKWSQLNGWQDLYERYLDDPIIILQNGRLILAGKVRYKDMDSVVSIHIKPTITPDGLLNLQIERILAGKLPLPQETMLSPFRKRLEGYMNLMLPHWRNLAQIFPNGAANEDLMKASLAKLAIHFERREPTDPVVFLPLVSKSSISVPVRITSVQIEDGQLKMTAIPLDAQERKSLLDRVRQPAEIESAYQP
jgi:hypothetical protein